MVFPFLLKRQDTIDALLQPKDSWVEPALSSARGMRRSLAPEGVQS